MKLRVPFYYDQFHCITSECKDNCCVGGWEIDIDDDTYNYYMSLDGELGDRIRESITKSEDGSNCFKLVDGVTSFQDILNIMEKSKKAVLGLHVRKWKELYFLKTKHLQLY